jgi:hypothetical protein
MGNIQRKDTRHTERLSKCMEGGAPGDLPGCYICYDKLHLQIQVTKLKYIQ